MLRRKVGNIGRIGCIVFFRFQTHFYSIVNTLRFYRLDERQKVHKEIWEIPEGGVTDRPSRPL